MAIENVLEAYGNNLVGAHIDNSSGSGGHTIEDAAGNDLQQQDTMQFLGSLKATDDPQNGKTLIDDTPTIVTWDEWNEMTNQQRAAIPKAQITNVPGADGTISAEVFKELWVNPSPTSSFAAQTITLSSDDYDFLLAEVVYSGTYYRTYITAKGGNMIFDMCATTASSAISVFYRVGTRVSDTSYSFGDATSQNSGASKTVDNSRMIPLKIYGFKKTLSLDFSAIASDVSTLASKCMLEDGETSVEKAITANEIDTAISLLSYVSASNMYTFPTDGYVHIQSSAHAGNSVNMYLYGATGSIALLKTVSLGRDYVYVKAGMRAYFALTGSDNIVNFNGLV